MYSMNFFLEKYTISKKIIYKWQQVTMYYYLCYYTLLPWRFFGLDKGENFIGFLSFIVINCVIFIVIADKSKCYKNETYSYFKGWNKNFGKKMKFERSCGVKKKKIKIHNINFSPWIHSTHFTNGALFFPSLAPSDISSSICCSICKGKNIWIIK